MPLSPSEFLVRELRRRRLAAGLTQDELGALINWSGTKVSAIECGTRPPKPEYLSAVDTAIGTTGFFMRYWNELIEGSQDPRVWLREWIAYEQQATALRWYELAWVPGLLQTEAYAREVFAADRRRPAEQVQEKVAARLERQRFLFGDNPPLLIAVLDESVLRRPIGGPAVMREQLFQLARLNTEQRRIRIHVVQSSVGGYSGLDGAFVLATLPEGDEVAYLDNRLQGQLVEHLDGLKDVRAHWEAILADALTLPQSTELLMEVAKTWT